MKKHLLLIACIGTSLHTHAQRIYVTEYTSQADLKVFVTEYETKAQLKVYVTEYETRAGRNDDDGIWYFISYATRADKKICFVSYPSQADLTICYVKSASRAGRVR